jgi:hypothetical protein
MNLQAKSAKLALPSAPARPAPPVYQPCPAREVVQARMAATKAAQAVRQVAPAYPHGGTETQKKGSASIQPQKPIQTSVSRVIMPARRLIAGAVETRPAPPAYRQQAGPARSVNLKSQIFARPPIQRYAEQTIDELGGEGVMSEKSNYFVANADTTLIWATSQPRYSRAAGKSVTTGGKTYSSYFSERLVRDCLHTAEEIIWEEKLKKGEVRSKIAGTSDQFGEGDDENIAAATKHASNDAAAPNVGQAYAIVNTKWGKNKVKSPYHAAAVVAVDGSDRITAEVFANNVDASKHGSFADYRMYTTGSGMGDKFHSYWQTNYFGSDSATVVIEKV